jgi:polyhydroxyalkanoate synthesis repressor PhaR
MALIKRYSNRKLYHSEAGRYVTLEDIAVMVRGGEDVRVIEHDTGRDLTTVVMLQVVVGEEKRLGELIPRVVLTRLLQDGGETLSALRAKMQAAFDPERYFAEQLRARMERLINRGEISQEEGRRLVESLLATQTEEEPLASPSEQPVNLDDLRHQVEVLEQELHGLMDDPG